MKITAGASFFANSEPLMLKKGASASGYCLGQQCLAGAQRAHQENSARQLRPDLLIPPRVSEVLDQLSEIAFRLLQACHVVERNITRSIAVFFRLRFSEAENTTGAFPHFALHPVAEIKEGADQKYPGKRAYQYFGPC